QPALPAKTAQHLRPIPEARARRKREKHAVGLDGELFDAPARARQIEQAPARVLPDALQERAQALSFPSDQARQVVTLPGEALLQTCDLAKQLCFQPLVFIAAPGAIDLFH